MTSRVPHRALRRGRAAFVAVALLAPVLAMSGTARAAAAGVVVAGNPQVEPGGDSDPAGQAVRVNDTAPTSDQWNLAAVEVRP